ncbi:hypothetical protein POF50_015395 [Streptomyces sp. SL13]|uniref:HTH araC/xylS-type domain-containing protein n=1 Tax=Streptantibioticus silvisoli TaxID=2705255 RepID=A0AA90JY17_9ACTN|nr:hypothetical protein [Streptantibioticus silvisoli]MDI5970706.1 hypothetical protein [Streptantibioticus silvisoli]
MLVAREDGVAAVGHLVGYDSPTRFSHEYRRLVVAPPGQDTARRRANTAPHDVRRLP